MVVEERAQEEAVVVRVVEVVERAQAEAVHQAGGPSRTPFPSRAHRRVERAVRAHMVMVVANLSSSPLANCSRGAVLVVGREIRYTGRGEFA